jgi:hypothetical protein
LDVSLGNVSVQVNMQFVGEAENGDSSVGFSYLPRRYYQLQAHRAQACGRGVSEWHGKWGAISRASNGSCEIVSNLSRISIDGEVTPAPDRKSC